MKTQLKNITKQIGSSLDHVRKGVEWYLDKNGFLLYAAPNSQTSTPQALINSGQACRLLAVAYGVNANAAATDTPVNMISTTKFSVFQVVWTNASISLTTATGGVYTATALGGTAIMTAAALSTCTGPTIVFQATVASTAVVSQTNLYVHITTAQGAAATVDCYIFGYAFDSVLP
jgi:hypothetical protein